MEKENISVKSDMLTINQIKDFNYVPNYIKDLGMDDCYDPLKDNKQYIEIFGYYPEQYLNIIRQFGSVASPTDFAAFNGCCVIPEEFTSEGNKLENRAGFYYTKSFSGYGDIMCAGPINNRISYEPEPINLNGCGIRPCFKYSNIIPYIFDKKTLDSGLTIGKISRYPKNIPDGTLLKDLLSMKSFNELKPTGNSYVINKNLLSGTLDHLENVVEYEFEKRYFVYVEFNVPIFKSKQYIGSNGELYHAGKYTFIEVEPIDILIDEQADIAICKDILIGNIPVWHSEKEIDEGLTYEKSYLSKYLNEYFDKDLSQNITKRLIKK